MFMDATSSATNHPLSPREKFTQNLTCCHTCCDEGPFFSRSHTKSRLILSSRMTSKGTIVRIYNDLDPAGRGGMGKKSLKRTLYIQLETVRKETMRVQI